MIGPLFALAVATSPAPAQTIEEFRTELSARLLDGARMLSVSQLRAAISALDPADRLAAIAFARRSGLYDGAPVPLAEILRDAPLLAPPAR